MKAKEYVARFQKFVGDNPSTEKVLDGVTLILDELYKEMFVLKDQRKVSTDAGFVLIVRELKQKWCAIYPSIPYTNELMFETGFKATMPQLYEMLALNGHLKRI